MLLLLPDSISQHTYNLLQDVLIQPDGLVVETVVGDQKVPTLSIDRAHPQAEALFDEAGVDASRARFPIVTFHRHNVLLSGPELELAFAGVNPPFNASDVETQREDWFPLWSADVGQASAAHSTIGGVQEEPSVLLLNTGPHWQNVVMGRPDIDEADFKPAFRKMVSNGPRLCACRIIETLHGFCVDRVGLCQGQKGARGSVLEDHGPGTHRLRSIAGW